MSFPICIGKSALDNLDSCEELEILLKSRKEKFISLKETFSDVPASFAESLVVLNMKEDGDCGVHVCKILEYAMSGEMLTIENARKKLIELFNIPRGYKADAPTREDVNVGCLANRETLSGVFMAGDPTMKYDKHSSDSSMIFGYTSDQIKEIKKQYKKSHYIGKRTARFLWDWELKLYCRNLGINLVILQEKKCCEIFEPVVGYYQSCNMHYAFVLSTQGSNHWELLGQMGTDGKKSPICVVFNLNDGEGLLKHLLARSYRHRIKKNKQLIAAHTNDLDCASRADIIAQLQKHINSVQQTIDDTEKKSLTEYKTDIYGFIENYVISGTPAFNLIFEEEMSMRRSLTNKMSKKTNNQALPDIPMSEAQRTYPRLKENVSSSSAQVKSPAIETASHQPSTPHLSPYSAQTPDALTPEHTQIIETKEDGAAAVMLVSESVDPLVSFGQNIIHMRFLDISGIWVDADVVDLTDGNSDHDAKRSDEYSVADEEQWSSFSVTSSPVQSACLRKLNPNHTILDDTAIQEQMSALQLQWKDENQTELFGSKVSVDRYDDVHELLENMGVKAMLLHVPGRTFQFQRSEHGLRQLEVVTEFSVTWEEKHNEDQTCIDLTGPGLNQGDLHATRGEEGQSPQSLKRHRELNTQIKKSGSSKKQKNYRNDVKDDEDHWTDEQPYTGMQHTHKTHTTDLIRALLAHT